MYAVIEVGGMQWKISKADIIRVPKVEKEPNQSIELDRILLIVDEKDVSIGQPFVPNVIVKATVLSHGKAEKIKVFKKKRRKTYKVLKGHRQEYTELRIDNISVVKEEKKKTSAPKKAAVKKDDTSMNEVKKKKTTPDKAEVKKAAVPAKAVVKKATSSVQTKTKKSTDSAKSEAKKVSPIQKSKD